jgi:hypothetical protein
MRYRQTETALRSAGIGTARFTRVAITAGVGIAGCGMPQTSPLPTQADLCRHNGNEDHAMKRIGLAILGALAVLVSGCGGSGDAETAGQQTAQAARGNSLVAQGRHIFRFETLRRRGEVD